MQWESVIAIDLETTGSNALDTRAPDTRITHFSWWNGKGVGDVIEVPRKASGVESQSLQILRQWLNDPTKAKVFWNYKYDGRLLKRFGYKIQGPILDGLLLAPLVKSSERSFSLKHFARKFLNATYKEEDRLKEWLSKHKGKSYGDAPKHIIRPYALVDARYTWELFYIMFKKLDKAGRRVFKQEMQLLPHIMEMEDRGILIDQALVDRLAIACHKEMRNIQVDIVNEYGTGYNINSNKQLVKLIYDEHDLAPVRRTKKGEPSVDKLALVQLKEQVPVCEKILKWRRVYKAKNTYIKTFREQVDKDNILRGYFNQSGARTGRFSSSGPNLQNITRSSSDLHDLAGQLRKCFIARPDYAFLFADYSQIELRLAAHFARVPKMIDAILAGDNLHAVTAKGIFKANEEHPDWKNYYAIGKTINFAVLFGAQGGKLQEILAKQANLWITIYEASKYLDQYHHTYPEIHTFFEDVHKEVVDTGGVRNAFGRYIEVPTNESYKGVNYKIQGTAADLIKNRLIKCAKLLKDKRSGMVLTVHDEIGFEIHKTEAKLIPQLVEIMSEPKMFRVPIPCDAAIGKRWGTKKDIKDLSIYE